MPPLHTLTTAARVDALPDDAEKQAVWEAYHAGCPTRTPLRWNVNPRIILLDPTLNPEGDDYATYNHDPAVHLRVQARFQAHLHTCLNTTCDGPTALPETWTFKVDMQNIHDAAYFGAEVEYPPGQVPDTRPRWSPNEAAAWLEQPLPQPADNPFLKRAMAFHAALQREAESFRHLGRGGQVLPLRLGFDGPLTVAINLFGGELLMLLAVDPELARRLLLHITRAVVRRTIFLERLAVRRQAVGWLADDCLQLISTDSWRDVVAPSHRQWFRNLCLPASFGQARLMHLCGDATRHFPTLARELGISSFDTGYPVDFAALRAALGPAVELSGGPRVSLLMEGTPEQCHAETLAILGSGVCQGGRFILQEGNNLPPLAPLENLAAVYAACRQTGGASR